MNMPQSRSFDLGLVRGPPVTAELSNLSPKLQEKPKPYKPGTQETQGQDAPRCLWPDAPHGCRRSLAEVARWCRSGVDVLEDFV